MLKKNEIRPEHIEQAALFWERNPHYHGFRESTKYDVIISGKPYPPKAIVAIARELAGLGELFPSDFAGAKDGKWHKLLKSHGFRIVPKGIFATRVSETGGNAFLEADIEEIERAHQDPEK